MKLRVSDYESHRDDYDGYCEGCDAVTNYGGVEPDARNYECEECGKKAVMGMDIALIMDLLEIVEDCDA